MTGRQSILGIAKVSSIPRKVYAATVYLDSEGRLNQGLPGQTTAEYCRQDKNAASAAGETNRKLNGHPEC